MDHLFDEFSKSLAESVPRRESLRRLGVVFAGSVLSTLGLGTAWAGRTDPCKAFCKCRDKKQQSQCLAVCQNCNRDTGRIGGSCDRYVCCSKAACRGVCSNLTSDPNCGACGNNCGAFGATCCGGHCADLSSDIDNCGRCGVVCAAPPPGEVAICVSGWCQYECAPGTVNCNGKCTYVATDPNNCGACGNVCPADAPNCSGGTCSNCDPGGTLCNGHCTNTDFDNSNCGACGVVCPDGYSCQGVCTPIDV
jgi:hypothetical protein